MVRPDLYHICSCLVAMSPFTLTGRTAYPDVPVIARSQWFRAVGKGKPARQGPAQGPQAGRHKS